MKGQKRIFNTDEEHEGHFPAQNIRKYQSKQDHVSRDAEYQNISDGQIEYQPKKLIPRLTSQEIDEEYENEQQIARELAQEEMERQRVQIQPALSPAISPENFDFAQSLHKSKKDLRNLNLSERDLRMTENFILDNKGLENRKYQSAINDDYALATERFVSQPSINPKNEFNSTLFTQAATKDQHLIKAPTQRSGYSWQPLYGDQVDYYIAQNQEYAQKSEVAVIDVDAEIQKHQMQRNQEIKMIGQYDDADDEEKLMEAAGLQDEIEKMEVQSPDAEMEEIIPQVEYDPRFYTLAELHEREAILDAQCLPYGNANQQSAHILLTPQEYRAKLYSLNMDNKWIDIGTGHFRILLSKDNEEHYMQIIQENVAIERDEANIQSGENTAQLQITAQKETALDSEGVQPVQYVEEDQPINLHANEVDNEMHQQEFEIANKQNQSFEMEVHQTEIAEFYENENQSGFVGQEDPDILLILHRSFISKHQEFSRQGDTIITWQDDQKREFALSFQEQRGALNTWFSICFIKGMQTSSNLDEQQAQDDKGNQQDSEELNDEFLLPSKENLQEIVHELYDSDPYIRRKIAQQVMKVSFQANDTCQEELPAGNGSSSGEMNSYYKDQRSQAVRTPYLEKLQRIFIEVEDEFKRAQQKRQNIVGSTVEIDNTIQQCVLNLHSLFQILRNLLSLNERELLEILLNENYWRTTFGALEYDPEVFMPQIKQTEDDSQGNSPDIIKHGSPNRSPDKSFLSRDIDNLSMVSNYSSNTSSLRTNAINNNFNTGGIEPSFRDFLETKVKFKEVVSINDQHVVGCIHLSYKLAFLKDTAMARFIDDTTSHTIMQLITSLHQQILEHIFSDEFDRIQDELLQKMHDDSNHEEKENAMKFFLEICALLKSIQLNHRFLSTCNHKFVKLLTVLGHCFDIMQPDRKTLFAECRRDKELLIKTFQDRKTKVDYLMQQNQDVSDLKTWLILPTQDSLREYLKAPMPAEDPNMTQIDVLKQNAIEIFCNLLTLNSSSNNTSVFQFLRSEEQRKNNHMFLRNLTQHMIYSNQMGLKVSICEFLKDLIGQEAQEMKQIFNSAIMDEVSMRLVIFLSDSEPDDFTDQKKLTIQKAPDIQMTPAPGLEETKSSDESELKVVKMLEQSRCLVLQFFTKLIQDSTFPANVRVFFVNKKVFNKIADLKKFNSRQINIEIIKFFKAIVASKDRSSHQYIIKHNIFEAIMHIFLENPNKRNLLNSCILSLFDLIANQMHQESMKELLKYLVKKGYAESVFLNPDYRNDFAMISSQIQQELDKLSEQDSKQRSDRDSNSQPRQIVEKAQNSSLPCSPTNSNPDLFAGIHLNRPVGLSGQMQSPAENGLDASGEEEFEEDFPGYFTRPSIKAENPPRLVFSEEKGNPDQPQKLKLNEDEPQVKELRNYDEEIRAGTFLNVQGKSLKNWLIEAESEGVLDNQLIAKEEDLGYVEDPTPLMAAKKQQDLADEEYNQQIYMKRKKQEMNRQEKRMPSPAVNRLEGTASPIKLLSGGIPKKHDLWPARDSRSMSPTRSKPAISSQNKIDIVIGNFTLPDRAIDEEKFVRERLYSDEKLALSESSENNDQSSPKVKSHNEDGASNLSSNPDLEDEFAFNKNWGHPKKLGTMLPPTEIFRQQSTSGVLAQKLAVKVNQRVARRSQSEEKYPFGKIQVVLSEPQLLDNPNTKETPGGTMLIGQKRTMDTATGLIVEGDIEGLDQTQGEDHVQESAQKRLKTQEQPGIKGPGYPEMRGEEKKQV